MLEVFQLVIKFPILDLRNQSQTGEKKLIEKNYNTKDSVSAISGLIYSTFTSFSASNIWFQYICSQEHSFFLLFLRKLWSVVLWLQIFLAISSWISL